MTASVEDVVRAIERRFPPSRAEVWDKVGLLAGDRSESVTGVLVALDPTLSAVQHAVSVGANVLVTHHPAYLEAPPLLQPGFGPSGVLFEAIRSGVALVNAHTNLDRDPESQRLIPAALKLEPVGPLELSLQPASLVTVFAPADARARLAAAMAGAGAGRLEDYEGCSFTAEGTGEFTPTVSAHPAVGATGATTRADEVRIEMVCPRGSAARVVQAAIGAHPYEEPLVTATDIDIARNRARLGVISRVTGEERRSLSDLADSCVRAFGAIPRVWGAADAHVELVASSTGSASSLIATARAAGADVLVAGEVRYHDALDAGENGLALVELGHDVSEWPMVALLEATVRSVEGLDPAEVHTLPARPGWWTPSKGNR